MGCRIVVELCCLLVALTSVCHAGTLTATCTMTGTSSDSTEQITGTVDFSQPDLSSTVTVTIKLSGFDTTDGITTHGFHIHQTGSTGNSCSDAGSHFDGVTSVGSNHGGPTSSTRHIGDLGNVVESNGKVDTSKTDSKISLKSSSNGYIIGRAVVIHQDPDDFGTGGYSDSLSTGHAGARIGCCVISGAPRAAAGAGLTVALLSVLLSAVFLR